MKNNKKMNKILALVMASVMCMSLMSVSAFAKGGKGNTGVGQTEAKIHLNEGLGNGSLTVTIDGKDYKAVSKGSQITIEMDSTDNGFDIAKGESKTIEYSMNGVTGSITFGHQEGNGGKIGNEHDSGLNNFRGSVNKPAAEAEVEETKVEEPKEEVKAEETKVEEKIEKIEEKAEEKVEKIEEKMEEAKEKFEDEKLEKELEKLEEKIEKTEEKAEEKIEKIEEKASEPEVTVENPETIVRNDAEEIEETAEEVEEEIIEEEVIEEVKKAPVTKKTVVKEEIVDEEIKEDIVPLAAAPVEVDEEIEEDIIPLAAAPELENAEELDELFDEEIPLAAVPQTSDSAMLWVVLMLLSGTAAAGLTVLNDRKVNG